MYLTTIKLCRTTVGSPARGLTTARLSALLSIHYCTPLEGCVRPPSVRRGPWAKARENNFLTERNR